MRNLGPALVLFGALGVAAAMFLPVHGFGGEDWTWWEYLNGLDVALFVACVLAVGFGLAALTTERARPRQASALGGGVVFGLAFALVPGAIDDTLFSRAGLWIGAAAGTIALLGSVITALSTARSPAEPGITPSRWRLAGIGITTFGVATLAVIAVTNPFGGATARATSQVPGVNDAAKLAREWAGQHKRSGEKPVRHACAGDGGPFEDRWACHIRFEPTRRVVTVYVRTKQNLRELKIVQVRSGEHSLPYP
jgi:hypothetical protein